MALSETPNCFPKSTKELFRIKFFNSSRLGRSTFLRDFVKHGKQNSLPCEISIPQSLHLQQVYLFQLLFLHYRLKIILNYQLFHNEFLCDNLHKLKYIF